MADNTLQGGTDNLRTDERTIGGNLVKVQEVAQIGQTAIFSGQAAPTTSISTPIAARDTRGRVVIVNQGTVDVYVGPSGVTTASGFKLVPGSSLMLQTTAAIFALTSSGTGLIHYIEEYDS